MANKSGKRNNADPSKWTATVKKLRTRLEKAEAATAKWKAEAKRLEAEARPLTTTVEKLRTGLEKAEAATAKWRAEAKRLDAETSKRAKQIKQLRKLQARPADASHPHTVAAAEQSSAESAPPESVPSESWSVSRLRASAREAGVVGYSRMTKAALLEVLTQR